ncbi:MAG: hypothetical protein HOP23_03765 [Methylococcaceae bacterium]|nr:hypothetical protein [Methylococcaceae bacterium]
MKIKAIKQSLRLIFLITMTCMLTGCLHWIRAYQTYLQMDEFDRYFTVTTNDDFTLHFKEPILYSKDFVSLAGLQPSLKVPAVDGSKRWRYWFRKIDQRNKIISPEIKFYSDLSFNDKDRIIAWSFSSLFLAIAPPKFLEVSLRSIGGAEINKDKMQLRANTDLIGKITAELPKKYAVTAQLGAPLEITTEAENEIYIYRFLLETSGVEEGSEDRTINEVKLTFDKSTQELIKMAGRFVGLKISINYRNLHENPAGESFEVLAKDNRTK